LNKLSVKSKELKYLISNVECHALASRLKHSMKIDSHSSPHSGYLIRSLYFDSYDDECLLDKQSGIISRKKYRLRIYDPDSEQVKFEIKHRNNQQVFKETATITRKAAKEVIAGNYRGLLEYDNPVLNKIYSTFVKKLYRPKVVVDYLRDAYIFDMYNVRITLDKNLRSSNTNFNIFSKNLPTMPVIMENKQILEVKYDECLPDQIRKMIQVRSSERMAISKYTLGRRFHKMHKWEDN
jgi:hypothetical protein